MSGVLIYLRKFFGLKKLLLWMWELLSLSGPEKCLLWSACGLLPIRGHLCRLWVQSCPLNHQQELSRRSLNGANVSNYSIKLAGKIHETLVKQTEFVGLTRVAVVGHRRQCDLAEGERVGKENRRHVQNCRRLENNCFSLKKCDKSVGNTTCLAGYPHPEQWKLNRRVARPAGHICGDQQSEHLRRNVIVR